MNLGKKRNKNNMTDDEFDAHLVREDRRAALRQLTEAYTVAMTSPGDRVIKSRVELALAMANHTLLLIDRQLDEEDQT